MTTARRPLGSPAALVLLALLAVGLTTLFLTTPVLGDRADPFVLTLLGTDVLILEASCREWSTPANRSVHGRRRQILAMSRRTPFRVLAYDDRLGRPLAGMRLVAHFTRLDGTVSLADVQLPPTDADGLTRGEVPASVADCAFRLRVSAPAGDGPAALLSSAETECTGAEPATSATAPGSPPGTALDEGEALPFSGPLALPGRGRTFVDLLREGQVPGAVELAVGVESLPASAMAGPGPVSLFAFRVLPSGEVVAASAVLRRDGTFLALDGASRDRGAFARRSTPTVQAQELLDAGTLARRQRPFREGAEAVEARRQAVLRWLVDR